MKIILGILAFLGLLSLATIMLFVICALSLAKDEDRNDE